MRELKLAVLLRFLSGAPVRALSEDKMVLPAFLLFSTAMTSFVERNERTVKFSPKVLLSEISQLLDYNILKRLFAKLSTRQKTGLLAGRG